MEFLNGFLQGLMVGAVLGALVSILWHLWEQRREQIETTKLIARLKMGLY
jgi:hypothetical protein